MSAPDRGLLYTTLRGEGHGELEDRRSVFLSHAAPVRTEEEALAFVKARQKEFSDATHNVWAFRLGADTVARYSDDGDFPCRSADRRAGFCRAGHADIGSQSCRRRAAVRAGAGTDRRALYTGADRRALRLPITDNRYQIPDNKKGL